MAFLNKKEIVGIKSAKFRVWAEENGVSKSEIERVIRMMITFNIVELKSMQSEDFARELGIKVIKCLR